MKAIDTSLDRPRGWGTDWTSGAVILRLAGAGAILSAIGVVFASAMGLAVKHALAIESSFLVLAVQGVLCLIVILPLASLLRHFVFPRPDDPTRQKVAILASRADRWATMGWVASAMLLATGGAWQVAQSLHLVLVANCVAAMVCVQQVLVQFEPHHLVLSLSGTDPRSLPEPTPADMEAAHKSGEQGVIWFSAGLLYVLFGLILVLLLAVYLRA